MPRHPVSRYNEHSQCGQRGESKVLNEIALEERSGQVGADQNDEHNDTKSESSSGRGSSSIHSHDRMLPYLGRTSCRSDSRLTILTKALKTPFHCRPQTGVNSERRPMAAPP